MVVESKKFCALRYSSAVLRKRSLASAYLPASMSELASLCILTGSSLTFSVMSVHSQSAIFSGALTFRFSHSARTVGEEKKKCPRNNYLRRLCGALKHEGEVDASMRSLRHTVPRVPAEKQLRKMHGVIGIQSRPTSTQSGQIFWSSRVLEIPTNASTR